MTADRDDAGRLIQLYSRMSDGELEKIASDSFSLTDVAQKALADEMLRRALQVVSPNLPPEGDDPQVELRSLTAVRKFRDLPDALLAKGSLESAGIESFLADDNMVRMDWFISNLLGGIKLLVKPEDIEAANQILDQPIPEDFAVDGVGEYRSPRCPNCQSLDVIEYAGAFIGLPSVLEPIWKCQACGSEWEDTGTGE
jgi:hypothetical protein